MTLGPRKQSERAGRDAWRPPTLADYADVCARRRQPIDDSGDSPLVTIVTVVFDGEPFLEQAIESVRSQNYPRIEYVIVDGGSTDRTLDIIRDREADIDHWISEPDEGIFDAMNKGIALATGKLIKLLNADDLLTPGSIQKAVSLYQAASEPCVIKGDMELIDAAGRHLKRMTAARALSPFGAVLHPTWYVDRCIYEQHGLYDKSLRVSADYEMLARLRTAGVPFVHADVMLARFRSGGASSTMVGLRERYSVNMRYLGRGGAVRVAGRQAYKKLRARLLTSLLGEHNMYRLRRRLARWMNRLS